MECPKCQGVSYLAEEEFIQVIDRLEPPKVVTKGTYVCKLCTDRFTRIHLHDVHAKARETVATSTAPGVQVTVASAPKTEEEIAEGLKFF